MDYIDRVYYTLLGELDAEAAISGVENAFAPGSLCDREYESLQAAYERLRRRLGAAGEDGDVETILSAMFAICHDVGRRMYRHGKQA